MPAHSNWHMMASVSMLGGIGFTVSLFICHAYIQRFRRRTGRASGAPKLGIVAGSLIAGTAAFIWLHITMPRAWHPMQTRINILDAGILDITFILLTFDAKC